MQAKEISDRNFLVYHQPKVINCSYILQKYVFLATVMGFKALFAVACIYKLFICMNQKLFLYYLVLFVFNYINKLTYVCINIISTYVSTWTSVFVLYLDLDDASGCN